MTGGPKVYSAENRRCRYDVGLRRLYDVGSGACTVHTVESMYSTCTVRIVVRKFIVLSIIGLFIHCMVDWSKSWCINSLYGIIG
jgi:hypothetical protein